MDLWVLEETRMTIINGRLGVRRNLSSYMHDNN